MELFSCQGYRRTKLSDVARSAGYAASTIRREFRGKSGLLEEVIRARGTCWRMRAPAASRTSSLEEVIGRLATWEVNRMREQREQVQALLPQDSLDGAVLHTACKLSLFDSTAILHDRLRQHLLGDGERQFLVHMIQVIGLRLGWSRFAEEHQTASCIKQIATTLAGGLACCRAQGLQRRQPSMH